MMAKLSLVCGIVVLGLVVPCTATTYVVGGTSGWDISSDIDTWTADKTFSVGDVLFFLYSSSHSVSEVTRKNFDGCNTTITLETYSGGNTTIPLTKAGEKYFVCGNKLHCLGGLKLKVNVEEDEANSLADAPAGAPAAARGSLPRPSSKSNNPATVIPTSHGFVFRGEWDSFVLASLGCMTTVIWPFL